MRLGLPLVRLALHAQNLHDEVGAVEFVFNPVAFVKAQAAAAVALAGEEVEVAVAVSIEKARR